MFDKDFWGEPISVYTDADALKDGTFTDISSVGVFFNELPINRATVGASLALDFKDKNSEQVSEDLQFIAANCTFDGDGADAWGIFQPVARLGNEKLWLIPNEVDGYTLTLPEEY